MSLSSTQVDPPKREQPRAVPRYPSLFQINTRVRLSELSTVLGRPATLDDISEYEIVRLAAGGFDFVWFLGVWQTGEAARKVSASNQGWIEEYQRILPDFTEADVCGSCFAIREYKVHEDFGGDAALARLRARMLEHGLRLILDFVPNHMAPDHPWVTDHPEWFVSGTAEQIEQQPQNYGRAGDRIVAYGRDPYFDGWPDAFQLNYGNPALQEAMIGELKRIARQCDGVRCDMAMLVHPEVFQRTWGIAAAPFWPRATGVVRAENPAFVFLAEVYWDLAWTLQHQGFNYTYDKRLYDDLQHHATRRAREHLWAGLEFQDHLVRFLENHDEPRAAATFSPEVHRAAAVVTFFTPGLRFFHHGQREGMKTRVPVHLARGPAEQPDEGIASFYRDLLAVLNDDGFRAGNWQLLQCHAAWDGNPTANDFIAFSWTGPGDRRRVVAVNYSDHASQCYVNVPWGDLQGRTVRFRDLLGSAVYERNGDEVNARGLYLDVPFWGYHVFEVMVG